ncbi:DUF5518 domain-containing protein [Haloarcula japonica]|nr:DUF5518 domain-containing protein [Haloarcula japonica]
MRESVTNAGIGALVTIALSFVPFSSVAGGAVAAANNGGRYRTGLWLGTLAGICAMVPLFALFIPALYIASLLGFGIPPGAPGYDLFLALVFAFFLLYTVGLSALGGLGGVWVSVHTDWDMDADHWL